MTGLFLELISCWNIDQVLAALNNEREDPITGERRTLRLEYEMDQAYIRVKVRHAVAWADQSGWGFTVHAFARCLASTHERRGKGWMYRR